MLSFHLQARHVLPDSVIPLTYAAAMGAAALAALASGHLDDRIGLRGLVIALPLSAVVPLLSFSTHAGPVWAGAIVWGAAMGIHESTLPPRSPTWSPPRAAAPDTACSPPSTVWHGWPAPP
ncbi:hypothetical protein [Nocardia sp. NPDC051981]|uniref:hypothetical protein n=1 Tax=Nocardia sp. NPDC051981 TaxID=3155417 RepID=UPI0034414C97